MATIGDLVVNLGLNRKGYSRGLQRSRSDLGSFVSGLKSTLARVALPALAAVGGSLAGRAAVNAASVQIAAERKLQAVLKATGGAAGLTAKEIQSYAGDLQQLTNFGDEATIAVAGVLATFTQIKGGVFKEALSTAQDISAVLGQDLQSSVVQLGKALNDPIKGMTALSDVGVSFSQEQKDQIKRHQEAGDLLGAQRVILGELNKEFGGAAAGMADPIIQAKNVLGDVAEIVRFVLVPPLNEVLNLFRDTISPITDSRSAAEGLGASLASVAKTILTPFANFEKLIFQQVVPAIDTIAFVFRNAVDLSELALLDLSLALFDLVPGTEIVAEHIAGTLVGLWDGTKAAGLSMVETVLGAINEMKDGAFAIFAGMRAALEALLNAQNPVEAFLDAAGKSIAATDQAELGGNPLAKFGESFSSARANIKLGFEQQGLGDSLRAERERILEGIGSNELAFQAKLATDATAGNTPLALDGGTTGKGSAGAGKIGGPAALKAGSAEAASAILKAQLASGQTKSGVEKLAEKQLKQQETMAKSLKEIAGRDPAIEPALEFAS